MQMCISCLMGYRLYNASGYLRERNARKRLERRKRNGPLMSRLRDIFDSHMRELAALKRRGSDNNGVFIEVYHVNSNLLYEIKHYEEGLNARFIKERGYLEYVKDQILKFNQEMFDICEEQGYLMYVQE